jgi:acetolactate synthase-1/2/3 large subunit
MGDAAFGMTGLDFETAVRCNIPILSVVLNNNFMAAETRQMATSHKLFGTQNVGGNYAEIGRALGGWSERVEDPEEVAPALKRAQKATQDGKAAMLEFITSREYTYSRFGD